MAHPPRQRFECPVFTRELRAAVRPAQRRWLLAVPALLALLCLWVLRLNNTPVAGHALTVSHSALSDVLEERGLLTTLLSAYFFCLLVLPALAGGAFAREREQGTLDALLFTRLSSWNIVLGKFGAHLAVLLLFLLLALPVALAYALQAPALLPDVGLGVLVTAATAALLIAISLYVSLHFRRIPPAVAVAYLATIGTFLPLPVVLILICARVENSVILILWVLALAIHLSIATLLLAWGVTEVWALVTRRAVRPLAVTFCWVAVIAVVLPCSLSVLLAQLRIEPNPYLWQMGNPWGAALRLSTYWGQLFGYWVDEVVVLRPLHLPPCPLSSLLIGSGILMPLLGTWVVLARTARVLDDRRQAE